MDDLEAVNEQAETADSVAAETAAEAELAALVPQRFAVCDADSANWVVRHIAQARAYAEAVQLWAEREKRRAQREEDFFLRRFGVELEAWARRELKKLKTSRKSIFLPAGSVGFRKVGAKLVVDDEPSVLDWASAHCQAAVIILRKLSKTNLNDHFAKTGELPDGTHLEPVEEKFFVK